MQNIIPLNHTIWAIYGNDEEMLKGNLKYFKNKVLAVNLEEDSYLIMSRDYISFEFLKDTSNFIGLYENYELDTEEFIIDLEVYLNNLLKGE
ncbi:MAG: hypothetical protein J6D47_20765 [Peptostreptococcaceae bacterium]|nr:hypothetical protein [Peptostreptococcaceae bacterium]MBP3931991.1 hypothetical protein [Peptostreptococcaceae bacterium]